MKLQKCYIWFERGLLAPLICNFHSLLKGKGGLVESVAFGLRNWQPVDGYLLQSCLLSTQKLFKQINYESALALQLMKLCYWKCTSKLKVLSIHTHIVPGSVHPPLYALGQHKPPSPSLPTSFPAFKRDTFELWHCIALCLSAKWCSYRMVSVYKFSAILFQDVGNIAFEKVCPEMTPADFEKFIEPVVMEYYEHGDSKDVLVSPVFAVDIFFLLPFWTSGDGILNSVVVVLRTCL